MERSGDDYTKLSVHVIPDLVPIRLGTRSIILAPLDGNALKCSRNFLREDILWIAHYRPATHATKTDTVNSSMRQTCWPAIEAYAL